MERSQQYYAEALKQFNALFVGENSPAGQFGGLCADLHEQANKLTNVKDVLNLFQRRPAELQSETYRLLDPQALHMQQLRAMLTRIRDILQDDKNVNINAQIAEKQETVNAVNQEEAPDSILKGIASDYARDIEKLKNIIQCKPQYNHLLDQIELSLKSLQESVPVNRCDVVDHLFIEGNGSGYLVRDVGGTANKKIEDYRHEDFGNAVWEIDLKKAVGPLWGHNNNSMCWSKSGSNLDYRIIDEQGKAWQFNAIHNGEFTKDAEALRALTNSIIRKAESGSNTESGMDAASEAFAPVLKAQLSELVEKNPPLLPLQDAELTQVVHKKGR